MGAGGGWTHEEPDAGADHAFLLFHFRNTIHLGKMD